MTHLSDLQKALIIVFIIVMLFMYCVVAYASGFTNRDAYEEKIRIQIEAIDRRIEAGTATKKDLAIHEYYVDRLATMNEVEEHKHKIK